MTESRPVSEPCQLLLLIAIHDKKDDIRVQLHHHLITDRCRGIRDDAADRGSHIPCDLFPSIGREDAHAVQDHDFRFLMICHSFRDIVNAFFRCTHDFLCFFLFVKNDPQIPNEFHFLLYGFHLIQLARRCGIQRHHGEDALAVPVVRTAETGLREELLLCDDHIRMHLEEMLRLDRAAIDAGQPLKGLFIRCFDTIPLTVLSIICSKDGLSDAKIQQRLRFIRTDDDHTLRHIRQVLAIHPRLIVVLYLDILHKGSRIFLGRRFLHLTA